MKRKPGKKKQPFNPRKGTYASWNMMLQRCQSKTHVSFAQYGGRGIVVAPEWDPETYRDKAAPLGQAAQIGSYTPHRYAAFERFIADVGLRPSAVHTLDRINPNASYTKDNVRWSTHKEQGVNKRTTKMVKHPTTGQPIAAATLAAELKVTYQVLRGRMVADGTWFIKVDTLEVEVGE